jgi:hypothetical protein
MNYNLEQLFINIISKGKKDNTYKFALAKYLLDISKNSTIEKDILISYEEISESFLKYYWIQECKYKIKQDFKQSSQPVIITIIQQYCGKDYISDSYDKYFKNKQPMKKEIIQDIETNCLRDVIPRFQPKEYNKFYSHNHTISANGKKFNMPIKTNRNIILYKESIIFFKENYDLLHKSLILEWAKFLEKTNFTPRLISKIENLGENKRSSLSKFKKMLIKIDNLCFYCNKNLDSEKIHIDHFIPWSYIFDDEIWNLVLSCSSCNLKKSDYLATEKCLLKISTRNNINNLTMINQDINEYYYNCKKSGFLEYNNPSKELLCL